MTSSSGKIAFVTDMGSSGGRQIAYRLINKGDMYVTGLVSANDHLNALIEKVPRKLTIIKRETQKEEDIQYAIKQTPYGNVLVNYVSFHNETFSTFTDSCADEWQQLIERSVKRMSVYAEEAINSISHIGHWGYIFNINSIVGSKSLCSAYRTAVMTLSESLAKNLSERGSTSKVATITAMAPYTGETFLNTQVSEFMSYESTLPNDIADAVIYALKFEQFVHIPEIIIKGTTSREQTVVELFPQYSI